MMSVVSGPACEPGEIVILTVWNRREQERNGRENDRGKARPAVVLGFTDRGATVIAAGLTTQATYGNGDAREPLRGWESVPLTGPAWLWSSRPVFVPVEQVESHLGWVSAEDAERIVEFMGGWYDKPRFLANTRDGA